MNNVRQTVTLAKLTTVFGVGLLVISLVGCERDDEIKVYRVSKAPLEEANPPASPDSGVPPVGTGSPEGSSVPAPTGVPTLHGKVPEGWVSQPLNSMRQASFLVKNNQGAEVDISLVVLGGVSGSTLENVNRWLSQLGQPPMTDEQLRAMAQRIKAPVGETLIVDLKGLPSGADPKKDGRIIAGEARTTSDTFFFKMRGNYELTGDQKKNFIDWIRSLDFDAPMSPGLSEPGAPASAEVGGGDASPDSSRVKWEVPQGWAVAPLTAMRFASYSVSNANGAPGDASVVVFPGEAGTDIDNVNRWRGQIALPAVEEGALSSLVTNIKGKNAAFSLVDLAGPQKRTLAAWTRLEGQTWFFKLTGSNDLVEREKAKFVKFLESVQFHPE